MKSDGTLKNVSILEKKLILANIVTKDSPCLILSRYMRGPIPKKSHIHGSIVIKIYSIELRHHEKLIDFKCEHCGKEWLVEYWLVQFLGENRVMHIL